MSKKFILFAIVCFAIGLAAWAAVSFNKDANAVKGWGGDQYEREYSVSIGPENAKVTLVEFFDPACEACRAFYPFVKEILSRHPDDVRLVLRYAAFHQGSDTVIKLLEIAREQEVFIPVLEALLKDQHVWASHHQPNIEKAWEIAEKAGLNINSAKSEIKSERLSRILEQENEDIRVLKIRQTPTFFVNKNPLEEFGPQQLYDLVVKEINN
jgi:protein-disulfide isomerase